MRCTSACQIDTLKLAQEILLTEDQMKIINSLLPTGFSLVISPKAKRKALLQPSFENIPKPPIPSIEDKSALVPPNMQISYKLLTKLKLHSRAAPFLVPVDPEFLGIPDYFTIIKEPMDFSTIENKLINSQYSTHDEFEKDVFLIYNNAKTYNDPSHLVHKIALEMEEFSRQLFRTHNLLRKPKTQQKLALFAKVEKEFEDLENSCKLEEQSEGALDKKRELIYSVSTTLPQEYLWDICRILAIDPGEKDDISIDLTQVPAEKLNILYHFALMHSTDESKKEAKNTAGEEASEDAETPAKRKKSTSDYWNSPEKDEGKE